MNKPQVVVIEDEYDLDTYYDKDEVEVIVFELRRFDDQYPDEIEIADIKKDIDKVKDPTARGYLDQWYRDNYRDFEADRVFARERLAQKRLDEIAAAHSVLEKYGEE